MSSSQVEVRTEQRDDSRRPSVLAIVLTFDAPEKLVRCLAGVLDQDVMPGRILVVDNASPLPAERVASDANLELGSVEFLRLPENVGPAGGYASALEWFLASPHDVAWVLDDDRVPAPDALRLLLSRLRDERDPTLVFPADVGVDGESSEYPSWCGLLIPKGIVQKVGVPRAEFFWWVEDTEYLKWRIPAAGFRSVRVREATVYHDRTVSERRPAWKYYYETRNAVYFRVTIQGGTRIQRLRRALARTVGRILLREDRKIHKLRMTWRGYRDGRAGRLGRTVSVPRRDESGKRGSE